MTDENLWRFLVIDDRQADETEELVSGHKVLDAPDRVIVEKCTKFKDALDYLNEKRIDLIILDLRDDSITLEDEGKLLAGEEVFNQICKSRFVPVVFYTAYPTNVKDQENPYTRVVKRDNPRALRKAIKEVFETRLPQLIRFLENEQRDYMWEHVGTHWQNFKSSYDKADLSYLLARRLANRLERRSIRHFLAEHDAGSPQENEFTVHPIEMYIYPPSNPELLAGDILKDNINNRDGYWVILTPSCDLEHEKCIYVILAACAPLMDQPEYKTVKEYIESNGRDPSNKVSKGLMSLIGNNRKDDYIQPERYYFLPRTFFLPDLVIDFQNLILIPPNKIKRESRIASMDSPFAEACLARFSRYSGRLGTPDIDKDFVYNRVVESIKKEIAK